MTNRPDRGRPPDVFLIGVPRSGTTSLYHGLSQHPRIFVADLKEACFTCPDIDPGTRRTPTRWLYDQDEYLGLFAGAGEDQLIVEGCIYNIYSPEAPGRIRQLNDGARILAQLRDPIEQMYSNHALKVIMRDTPSDSFEEALAIQDGLRNGRTFQPLNMGDYDLRDKAIVSFGLQRFLEEFGRDRIHITYFDDFARDSHAVYGSVFRFLGVAPTFIPQVAAMVPNRVARWSALNRAMGSPRLIAGAKRLVPGPLHGAARRAAATTFRLNRRRQARPALDRALRDRLRAEFRPEVHRLSELVGVDLVARWWS